MRAEAERIEREDLVPLPMPSVAVQRLTSKHDQIVGLLSAEAEGEARREVRRKWTHAG
ncbi:hypothetical protein NQK81_41320 [Amycolatopsis roodepoortensis]|uniref:hypothetical protein n=1 Tax=Amycolatopsis roodepoortensis TaxID=700274 RepID=UPI00214C5E14|nr:hypothetical protein [Amycolatopsis roodepoortensis]UUV31130.1 hypothetical protein NQK81_41320 [Amycolatopsis roodepoortensis]